MQEVELPGIGTASGFGGKRTDTETLYFPALRCRRAFYRFDLITAQAPLLRRAEVKFNPDEYVTTQVFYESKDGTRMPMFITHKKGQAGRTEPDVALRLRRIQHFDDASVSRSAGVAWMEMGGVYAMANLRGGGEYGEDVASGRHETEEAERVRRLHRRGRVADREPLHQHRRSWRSKGAATADCWSGPAMTQRPDLFAHACRPSE